MGLGELRQGVGAEGRDREWARKRRGWLLRRKAVWPRR